MVPHLSDEVRAALDDHRPVVALETTLVTHGLPPPHNLEVAREAEAAVRQAGAVPATIAILDGRLRAGLERAELERLARPGGAEKLSLRDLGPALARGATGGRRWRRPLESRRVWASGSSPPVAWAESTWGRAPAGTCPPTCSP